MGCVQGSAKLGIHIRLGLQELSHRLGLKGVEITFDIVRITGFEK